MNAQLDLIEERLNQTGKRVRRKHDSLQAQCPAHEDRNPSLTVSHGDRQDIVLHCHAGCTPTAVLTALNLTFNDISTPRDTPQRDTHYLYTDSFNKPLFRVVRTPDKKFWQQRLTPNGEWVNGLGDTVRVLYRLSDVQTAVLNNKPIWIVEGEKDADRLHRMGLVATTNPGGAGKWLPHHTQTVAGAELHIVADKDDPGRAHATQIRDACTPHGCRVTIWEAATGKDITDHLNAGHRIDELIPWGDTPPNPNEPLNLIQWDKFWTQDHNIEEWVVYPLIPAGRTISLYAPAKAGKSTVVLACVAAAVAGKPVLGIANQPHQPQPQVLYLDYEMTEADIYERLSELGYGPQDNLTGLHYSLIPQIDPLDTERGAQTVLEAAQRLHVDLVVIDTFGRAVEGEENNADTVRAFYRLTAMALKRAGIACLRTDHAGKQLDKGQRGTSAKNDDVDVVWQLSRQQGGVKLVRTHSRVPWVPQQLDITQQQHDNGNITYQLTTNRTYPDGTAEVAALLDDLNIDIDVSARTAITALREAGHKARNDRVRAAVQMRRQRLANPFDTLPTPVDNPVDNSGRGAGARPPDKQRGAVSGRTQTHQQKTDVNQEKQDGAHHGARWGAADLSARGALRHPKGGAAHETGTEEDEEGMF
jgi:KaiC/GvpD/RAD55 family RecA-like ATPase